MSVSLNATNVRREKKNDKKKRLCGVQQDSCSLDLKCRSCWSGPIHPPFLPPPYIKRKEKTHLKMLRLWCELCVIVCSCFLVDSAERGPYLNTRKNKDSLQSNWMVSVSWLFHRWCSSVGTSIITTTKKSQEYHQSATPPYKIRLDLLTLWF